MKGLHSHILYLVWEQQFVQQAHIFNILPSGLDEDHHRIHRHTDLPDKTCSRIVELYSAPCKEDQPEWSFECHLQQCFNTTVNKNQRNDLLVSH